MRAPNSKKIFTSSSQTFLALLVCSCHFKDGKKRNGPSIFPWNQKKIFNFASPQKRRKLLEPEFKIPDEFDENKQHAETQTISTVQDQAEITLLNSRIEKLKAQVELMKKQPFSFFCIAHDDEVIKYYTGICKDAFFVIADLCIDVKFNYFYKWKATTLSLNDHILMTLMKLRLNLGYVDLGVRVAVSTHNVANVNLTFIHLLHEILFENGMKDIPSQQKNILSLPYCFTNFRNCRIVIECTEFRCAIPKPLDEQKKTYSNYKHSNTLKGLIGVAPNGTITYVSKMYPGSSSDKGIVKDSEILKKLQPGDLVLADKGFLLDDIVPNVVSVNIPPFLYSAQFTPTEIEEGRNIAKARIHVERAIRRLKLYRILHFIPKTLYQYSTKIIQLSAALTNFQNPLINEVCSTYENFNTEEENEDLDNVEMDFEEVE